MILVDTSVWINHLRKGDANLVALLNDAQVLMHPFVIGELALGHLKQRRTVLGALQNLPQAIAASDDETLNFIERHKLFGQGIGYIDAHMLAATRLTPDSKLWTRDKALRAVSVRLSLAADIGDKP